MFRFLFVLITTLQIISGDYYSSNSGLEDLLEMELVLIENLESFVKAEEERKLKLQKFLETAELESEKIESNPAKYFENPLNAWKVIKRFARDWRDVYLGEVYSKNAKEYAENRVKVENATEITKPVLEDVLGAARGIARLQRTYNLKSYDLADGIIMGRELSLEMPASDCYDLGMGLLHSGDHKHAFKWFLEARERLKQESKEEESKGTNPIQEENIEWNILDGIVHAAVNSGSPKLALWFIREQLAKNPEDEKVLESLSLIENRTRTDRLSEPKQAENRTTLTELYEKTCSGERRQTPKEQRNLRCRYVHNNVPFCYIAPFKLEVLNMDPFVAFYHEAIYENEIEYILEAVEETVERSRVGGKDSGMVSEVRTSKNSWLPWEEHDSLNHLAQRLNDITGLSLLTAEPLQIANYGIGGHYAPHYDVTEDESYDYGGRGNRILTALFYINKVEFGGATAFPYLKLAVPPIRRSLVVWYNMHRSLEIDYRTSHGGCPVIHGSKWICNEWYHTLGQEFNRPCGLKPEGNISIGIKNLALPYN